MVTEATGENGLSKEKMKASIQPCGTPTLKVRKSKKSQQKRLRVDTEAGVKPGVW